jgi:hypothetical protein
MFKNRVLRKIFVAEREEVTRWREQHNEELCDLFLLLDIVRMMK